MNSSADFSPALLLDAARFRGELDGKPVALYTLRNSRGMVVCITNYGAKIEQMLVPGRDGQLRDVVLGYDSLEAAVGGSASMGAFIGRYAGRIGGAAFTLDGMRHQLTANNGPHCLHGGLRGSRFRVFDAVQRSDATVEMNCLFADGEEGFPGTLQLRLVYTVTEANELVLDYEATALDKPTVASFTTHAFFNLNGPSANSESGDVRDHEVMICADSYFAATDELVATGDILPVAGTALDFRSPVLLRDRMQAAGSPALSTEAAAAGVEQAAGVAGYDHCYLLNRANAQVLALAARLSVGANAPVMEVWSTEPAMQFYTGLVAGERMPGAPGKSGHVYRQQQSLCLEPQGYPNAPNCPGFPSAVHAPGLARRATTVYRFTV
ncbi:MAG: aldose epimerase family protein [Pseudomonadota bacterium]